MWARTAPGGRTPTASFAQPLPSIRGIWPGIGSAAVQALGLLHHDSGDLAVPYAFGVLVAERMPELVVDQVATVICEITSVAVRTEDPPLGVQYYPVAVLAGQLTSGEQRRAQPVSRRGGRNINVHVGPPGRADQLELPFPAASPAPLVVENRLDRSCCPVDVDR